MNNFTLVIPDHESEARSRFGIQHDVFSPSIVLRTYYWIPNLIMRLQRKWFGMTLARELFS